MTVPRKVDRRLRSKNLRSVEDCGRRFFVRSKNLRPPVEESSTAVFECNLRYLFERSYRREYLQKTYQAFKSFVGMKKANLTLEEQKEE